ncbi:unnamed protein product [Rhizophagus irregularis]|nr:unnamed protein product [Rhizophagus irregularis]CAB5388549.1 unnamed protein product [Rhizophagus irregularis]
MDNIKFRKPLFIEVEKSTVCDLYEVEAIYDEERSTKLIVQDNNAEYLKTFESPNHIKFKTVEEFRTNFSDSGMVCSKHASIY